MSDAAGDPPRLHADVAGEGTPLVLLHGFTGSGASWAPLRAALGDGVRMIAVELPGHGRSEAPDDPARYAMPVVADALAATLDQLGVERAPIMGYSLGGRTALHFALRHPARVRGLVLESASPGIANEDERVARLRSDHALADTIEREGIAAFVTRWEALPLWESQRALPDAERERLRAQRLRNDARGLANSLRGAGAGVERSLEPLLRTLAMPVLLVAGALDAKYVAIAHRMEREMPGARLHVVEDAGHALHLERPAELAMLVRDFIAGG